MEEKQIIELCRAFAKKADELETIAFKNINYKENSFTDEFNKLFNQYCFGKQNRTISGLNFGQPPRYDNLKFCTETNVESLSKTKYQVTFWAEPKFKTIRFILDKRKSEWKLIRFETYLGISNQEKTKGEEIWRKHKL